MAEVPWGPGRGSLPFQLALTAFAILAMELAVIRWTSCEIRMMAYFSNIVLLAAFLGLGLGMAVGRRRPQLMHAALPVLAALSLVLAFSDSLGLVHMRFPDLSIHLWGSETAPNLSGFVLAALVVTALFWPLASLFFCMGAALGWLFGELAALQAYRLDLIGSLLGITAVTAFSALGTPPVVWVACGVVPWLWLSRRPHSFVTAALALGLAWVSAGDAVYSPYYRIDVSTYSAGGPSSRPSREWVLNVNHDFHQFVLDLGVAAVEGTGPTSVRSRVQRVYDLPFRVTPRKDAALIVGAGTGNDAAAALRNDFASVQCLDIDPVILRLGAELHPERPYADPRIVLTNNDARAWFEQNPDGKFDVVCYGLLDSHAMFSSMSSLRLDNYVYTVEGIRSGWQHVRDDGVLSVCFCVYGGDWLRDRLFRTIQEATGLTPVVIPHGMQYAVTYLVGRNLDLARLPAGMPVLRMDVPLSANVTPARDDWPFLYLRPHAVPYAYLVCLALILLTAVLGVRAAYGRTLFTAHRFDTPLFFMGAAFMLLETRLVTELSLLFGSTWVVNSCVFAGILLMALIANQVVVQWPQRRVSLWYLPLAASLLLCWALSAGTLNRYDLLTRGVLGSLIYALPVAFAGIIFSTRLARSREPSLSFGSNLLGAVVGGLSEYATMALGLKATALMAIALYGMSWMTGRLDGGTSDPHRGPDRG